MKAAPAKPRAHHRTVSLSPPICRPTNCRRQISRISGTTSFNVKNSNTPRMRLIPVLASFERGEWGIRHDFRFTDPLLDAGLPQVIPPHWHAGMFQGVESDNAISLCERFERLGHA